MHPRATVDKALRLSEQGLVDREVAQITGVSIGAVQKWRTGLRRTPEKELKHARCPRCDGVPIDEAAYAYLRGLYLGDGHISRHRRGVFALSIACGDVWPGLIAAAKQATRDVVPTFSVFGAVLQADHDLGGEEGRRGAARRVRRAEVLSAGGAG